MLGIFVLINILHASKSYPYRRYHYVPTQPPWHHLYRQPNLFQQIPMQNYGFHGAPGGSMRSHTTEVDTEGERDIQDFLKQYVYVLLLAKLFSETEAADSESRSVNAPFQRTDTLPTPDTPMNDDQPSSEASPAEPPHTTNQIATTEDYYKNWVRVGECRYQAVSDQQNYHYAKQDCGILGARLAAPGIIKKTTDLSSFSAKMGLTGIAYWIGVEEDSNGSDIASNQDPTYSENGRFLGQQCLAIVAQPDAVLNSYMSCQRTAPAYVCQVC